MTIGPLNSAKFNREWDIPGADEHAEAGIGGLGAGLDKAGGLRGSRAPPLDTAGSHAAVSRVTPRALIRQLPWDGERRTENGRYVD
jgi:hypothetical protein